MGIHFHGTAEQRSAARTKIVRAALLAHRNASDVHYTQGPRRWDGIRLRFRAYKGKYPKYADCSALVAWVYWDALKLHINRGLGDILNGQKWKGGYTGTLLDDRYGKVVARGAGSGTVKLLRGDVVIYGRPGTTGAHTAVVVDPARRLVVSHGSEAGPYLIPMNYRSDIICVKRYIY